MNTASFYFCHFDFLNFSLICSVTVWPPVQQSSIFSNTALSVSQHLGILVVLETLSALLFMHFTRRGVK